MEKFKIENEIRNKNFSNCLSYVFDQKLFITLFLEMIYLHKLHPHVHYEEVYEYKRFQKFNIKIVTKIAYPNFKNKQKTGLVL